MNLSDDLAGEVVRFAAHAARQKDFVKLGAVLETRFWVRIGMAPPVVVNVEARPSVVMESFALVELVLAPSLWNVF